MAGGVEPQRTLALPDLECFPRFAGAATFVTGAARTKVLRRGAAEIVAEAEPFVGQPDRPVRIAFARGDAVAEARYEDVANPDLRRDPLRRVGSARDVNSGHCLTAIPDAQIDWLGAFSRGLLRTAAVVERPGAGRPDRNNPVEPYGDGMIDRGEIALLDV